MFNKLQIRFFRKNEKVDVALEPITMFRGPSGKGKSSLVGAIKWLAFDSPSGTAYIHWDHDYSAVRLIEGKTDIIRKRSASENYYKLNRKKYKAFGTKVPAPIADVLNMSKFNFHRQQVGPFWFRETAGEVSRQLNSIVNLDLIDTTLSDIESQQRQANAEKSVIEQRIKEAKQQKRKLRWIVGFDKRLKALEQLGQQHEENADKLITLVNLCELARQYQVEASRPIPKVGGLMKLCEKYERLNKQRERLSMLFGQAEEYEEVIHQSELQIKRDEKELQKLIGKRCPLCGK
jgi:hypothetical protein